MKTRCKSKIWNRNPWRFVWFIWFSFAFLGVILRYKMLVIFLSVWVGKVRRLMLCAPHFWFSPALLFVFFCFLFVYKSAHVDVHSSPGCEHYSMLKIRSSGKRISEPVDIHQDQDGTIIVKCQGHSRQDSRLPIEVGLWNPSLQMTPRNRCQLRTTCWNLSRVEVSQRLVDIATLSQTILQNLLKDDRRISKVTC